MEIIDRKTAIDLGLLNYYTGKPCRHGHVAPRRCYNGVCTVCAVKRTQAWRENGSKPKDSYNPAGKELPSQDFLRECFDYIFNTGQLIWRTRPISHFLDNRAMNTWNSRFSGEIAGHYHSRNGYLEIRFNNSLYKGHRIIYKLLTGEDPENFLDHADGDVSNNRIENLRIATAQENARNSRKRATVEKATSSYKGVSLNKNGRQWNVTLSINDNETKIVEFFDSEIEAAIRYDDLAKEHYGEFANLNFPEPLLEGK